MSQNVFQVLLGYPREVLIEKTPGICKLLLMSRSVPHNDKLVIKWMNQLKLMLEECQMLSLFTL